MKITQIKINGIYNPVGFNLDEINVSYVLDGIAKEICLDIFEDASCLLPVYKQRLDYKLSFCTSVKFKAEYEKRYYFTISADNVKSDVCYFERGTLFDCKFIGCGEKVSHPEFFKKFRCESIDKARLYITGLGLYTAYINGKKVGNEYLTPNCNDYTAYLQYQTYDITDMIKANNEIKVCLGDGWYKGRFGLSHKTDIYGSEYMLAAKIVLWDKYGNRHAITTDDSWKYSTSKTVCSSIYDGETVDMTLRATNIYSAEEINCNMSPVERVSLPVVVKQTIKPELITSKKGEKILDFGQNFAGFVSFDCNLMCGQKIKLTAGEVLQDGCFYRDNLRSAKAEFIYVSDGVKRNISPQFTFYGFRYMLVEGVSELRKEDFTGNVIYSDMEQTIEISTENAKINRLLLNCLWGQKSNFVDVPTDCPQRDERLGWTGDAEIFCSTACFQMDSKAFYTKYLKDIGIEQSYLNGGIPSYAPSFRETKEGDASVWADAATIIPWTLYRYYGDKSLLKKHYPIMEGYVDTVIKQDNERGGKRLYNFGFHLGDWLSQDGASPSALKGATNEYFIASVYYYNSVNLVAKAAKELGYKDKAKKYTLIAKEIKRAVLGEYFTPSGRLAIDTQTAYVICITFDLYKDKQKLVRGFAKRLKKDGYKIKGGFVGATQLIQAMLKCGFIEDAFRILYSERFPSWLYCVNLGATTIWERWNSLNADGTISGTQMNSLNHYSFGAVASAFYGYIAGLKPISSAFRKVIIEPVFNYRLQKLDFKYRSVSGEFAIGYTICGCEAKVEITVPYGVEATFRAADKDIKLDVGYTKIIVPLSQDMQHPYSVDTKVCDLLEDERASEVLKSVVPSLYAYITNNDIGLNGESFRALTNIAAFRIPEQAFIAIDGKLKEIEYV